MTLKSDPFDRFLQSSDLMIWQACLDQMQSKSHADFPTSLNEIEHLVQRIIVSCYIQWLGDVGGDKKSREKAQASYEEDAIILQKVHLQDPTPASEYGIGILAAWKRYIVDAKRIIFRLKKDRPENILLLLPDNPAKKASLLRSYVFEATSPVFPPILYFYGDALLSIGALNGVLEILSRMKQNDPMTLDLRGRMYEQTSDWKNAFEVYNASKWPVHSYRAVICRTILDAQKGQSKSTRSQELNGTAIQKALSSMGGEISQSEVARSLSFINACRWNSFDDWIISFELALLNFRLKRHTEAEQFFRNAVSQAPLSTRNVISDFRFTNLTWMNAKSPYQDLNLTPELLECGRSTIETTEDIQLTASTNVWVGVATNDLRLVEVGLKSSNLFVQGDAYDFTGDRPAALKAWRKGMLENYYPRIQLAWIKIFNACQFDNTLVVLVNKMVENSAESFFDLWELGKDVLNILGHVTEISPKSKVIDKCLDIIIEKLEMLSEHNFQNLMRLYHLLILRVNYNEAELVLNRASKLAEGPEENIQLAIARRKTKWFTSRSADELGLNALIKAERESRDRLQRLQIARELCHFGQPQRARAILVKENVFDSSNNLSPLEYTLAIQSGLCLQQGEVVKLFENAKENLRWSLQSGLIRYYPEKFAERLGESVGLDPSRSRNLLPAQRDNKVEVLENESVKEEGVMPTKEVENLWKHWRSVIMDIALAGREMSDQRIAEICAVIAKTNLDTKLSLWEKILDAINDISRNSSIVVPDLDQQSTPISKSGTVVDDWRAQELTDLWRKYIRSESHEDRQNSLGKIVDFNREEERLLLVWEQQRQYHRKPYFQSVLQLSIIGKTLLESIAADDDMGSAWPMTWDLQTCIRQDIQELKRQLDDRIIQLNRQLQLIPLETK